RLLLRQADGRCRGGRVREVTSGLTNTRPAPHRPGTGRRVPTGGGRNARQAARRFGVLVLGSLVVLVVAGVGGLAIGSHPIELPVVIDALTAYDPGDTEHVIVIASRLPRTVLGVV